MVGPGRGNGNGEAGISSQAGLLPSPQRDNRVGYLGVSHNTIASNVVAARMGNAAPEADSSILSAAAFPMVTGIGHSPYAVQYQHYNIGEGLHQQWPGPAHILPQGTYFVNDLFNVGK